MTQAAELTAAALVVGGGISGMSAAAACAADAGDHPVMVLDRGRRLGGRMAARTVRSGPWAGHVVDLGAAYFTVSDPEFAAVVDDWQGHGLVRPWTDTFAVAGPDGITGSTTGPMRFASPNGLRALVADLAGRLSSTVVIHHPAEATAVVQVDTGWWVSCIGTAADAAAHLPPAEIRSARVALCVPPPQAIELLATPPLEPPVGVVSTGRGEDLASLRLQAADYPYEPILALVAQWPERLWDTFAGCFVNGDEVLSFIADDGDRRGDGAAVLVAHSTPEFALHHLLNPSAAGDDLVAALCRILHLPRPSDVEVKRWGLARPVDTDPPRRDAALAHQGEVATPAAGSFLIGAGGTIGIASDAFSPRPRVESAWLSGRHLGMALSSATGTA